MMKFKVESLLENEEWEEDAEIVAARIATAGEWDINDVEKLIAFANMEDEWEALDKTGTPDDFMPLLEKAAKKLDVKIY